MSPRALTEQEKDLQSQKLMTKARELVLAHGVRRVSVDDIVQAAGIAKGSFYHYFSSKEDLLLQLVWDIYSGFLAQAEVVITGSTGATLRENVAGFIRSLLHDTDKVFFFQNHEELETLIATMGTEDLRDFSSLEQQGFARLIRLAGKDISIVKPGVVHNYIHAMYFAVSDGVMAAPYLEETIDAMLAGLLDYIFGGEGGGNGAQQGK